MKLKMLISAILIAFTFNSHLFSDGIVTECMEYEIVENKNPFSDSMVIDKRLIGRWLSTEDKDYKIVDNYGIIFTETEYINTIIYEFDSTWTIVYKGKGEWLVRKNRLYINCSWVKERYEFDSTKITGKLLSIDSIPESIFNMKYQLSGDSLLCIYWREEGGKPLFNDHFRSDIRCKKECFRRIPTKQ